MNNGKSRTQSSVNPSVYASVGEASLFSGQNGTSAVSCVDLPCAVLAIQMEKLRTIHKVGRYSEKVGADWAPAYQYGNYKF